MQPGDLLCLYTDGITEAAAPDDEEFGLDRLAELIADGRREPIDQLLSRIGEAVSLFAADAPQADDQTLLLLRRSL
jgi:sigma-B regulation protein RsbU (phosphoserine phosphatase)